MRATAAAGSTIQVAWSGPDYDRDYIAVTFPDAAGSRNIHYTYTNAGNPLQLEMPDKPGTYEIRYILRQSRGILARESIEVR